MMKALVAATALTFGLATGAAAQTWNLPSGYSEGNFHSQNLMWFADQVREGTNGEIDIVVHPAASLIKLPEIKRAVQSGQVPIGEILISTLGNEDPLFEADMVPFLASGIDNSRKLYQAQKDMVNERFAKQNLVVLYSVCWPGNGVFAKEELNSLSDMDGMKFRAYNAMTARVAELFGAQPVTIQVPEIPQAFLTGLAEVMLTSSPVVTNSSGWDYGNYWYDFNAFHPRNAVIVNKRMFDGLPEEQRNAILDAAARAEERGWELCQQDQEQNLQKMADNGIQVIEPSPEMRAEFEAVAAEILNDWVSRTGEDGATLREAMTQ